MIDPQQFHDTFFQWTKAVAGRIEGVVDIDGKTIHRSKDESKGNRPSHVVSAWDCNASLVLGQLQVDEKTNEIKAIPCILGCPALRNIPQNHLWAAAISIRKMPNCVPSKSA